MSDHIGDANGFKYEFYTPGASKRSYWRNALTRGVVRRIGSNQQS